MFWRFWEWVIVRDVHVVVYEFFIFADFHFQNRGNLVSEIAKDFLDLLGLNYKVGPSSFVAF